MNKSAATGSGNYHPPVIAGSVAGFYRREKTT